MLARSTAPPGCTGAAPLVRVFSISRLPKIRSVHPPVMRSNSFAVLSDGFYNDNTADSGNSPILSPHGKIQVSIASGQQAESISEIPAATSTSGRVADAATSTLTKPLKHPLVWIDLEMTGLTIDKDTIIEVACIITDGDLAMTIEGPSLVIHHEEQVLASMNAWCIEHHGRSGLTQRVRDSTVGMREAELAVLAFVQEHVPVPGAAQLAGNSIHVDRMFLNKYMPDLLGHLNYRVVDVSSIRELARRWYPEDYKRQPRKASSHTAMADILESLEELRYYREKIFKTNGGIASGGTSCRAVPDGTRGNGSKRR